MMAIEPLRQSRNLLVLPLELSASLVPFIGHLAKLRQQVLDLRGELVDGANGVGVLRLQRIVLGL